MTALWTQPQHIGPYNGKDRPNPVKAALPERRFPCDVLIVAIGQSIVTQPFEAVGVTIRRGTIQADLSSSVPGLGNLFAGGDAVSGPATVIRAVAAGKVAADNIDSSWDSTTGFPAGWRFLRPISPTPRPAAG